MEIKNRPVSNIDSIPQTGAGKISGELFLSFSQPVPMQLTLMILISDCPKTTFNNHDCGWEKGCDVTSLQRGSLDAEIKLTLLFVQLFVSLNALAPQLLDDCTVSQLLYHQHFGKSNEKSCTEQRTEKGSI